MEGDQRRQHAGGGHFEHRAAAARAAAGSCAVEIAVTALHQPGRRIVAIGEVEDQCLQSTVGRHLEHRAKAIASV